MLRKIISQIKNISPCLLNLILFLITLSTLLIIAFYQLFVDQNHRFFNPKKFLKPSFIVNLLKQIRKPEIATWDQLKSGKIITNTSFLSPNKDKTAFVKKGEDNKKEENSFVLHIFKVNEDKSEKIVFDSFSTLEIIHWGEDNQRIYLSYQDQKGFWYIGVFENGEIKPLVEDISFKGEKLTSSLESIKDKIVYPQCDPNCHFVIYNLNSGVKETIPVVDETPNKEFLNLELEYFDSQSKRIIYRLTDKNMAYIIDFSSYLWHYFYLNPEADNLIEIKGVVVDSQENKKLIAFSELKSQIYLYDINDIGLELIEVNEQEKKDIHKYFNEN